jgi:hypothetical protein
MLLLVQDRGAQLKYTLKKKVEKILTSRVDHNQPADT